MKLKCGLVDAVFVGGNLNKIEASIAGVFMNETFLREGKINSSGTAARKMATWKDRKTFVHLCGFLPVDRVDWELDNISRR